MGVFSGLSVVERLESKRSFEFLSLYKYTETDVLHIFESKKQDGGCKRKANVPLCKNKDLKYNVNNFEIKNSCLNQKDMRKKCADLANQGVNVCGNCVRRLYHNED